MHEVLTATAMLASLLGSMSLVARSFTRRVQRDLTVVLTSASLEASLREQELVTIEHMMLALSFDPAIEERLRATGIDAAALREELEASLGPLKKGIEEPVTKAPRLEGRLTSFFRRAGGRRPTVIRLFEGIRHPSGPESVSRTLLERLSKGRAAEARDADAAPLVTSPYRSAPSPGDAQVRFWNDPRTTMFHVTSALVETCGLEASRARYLMLRVHFVGSAVVGVWPETEARALVDRVTAHARKAGFALRATVEPKGAKPPGILARVLGRAVKD